MINGGHIVGIEQAQQLLKEFPINADKIVVKGLRKASSEFSKNLKTKMPRKSWARLVGSTIKKGKIEGIVFARIGLREKNSAQHFEWMKAYWSNYGTLSNRDKSHKFTQARKSKSANWKGGIKPANFFEKAMIDGEQILQQEFEKNVIKQLNDRYE